MPEFIIAYRGGKKPETPEEGAKQFQRWKVWLEDLGEAVVNPGTPLGPMKTVSGSDVTDNTDEERLTGFSIVRAEDLDEAIEMAKKCPFLEMGSLDVAQVMQLP